MQLNLGKHIMQESKKIVHELSLCCGHWLFLQSEWSVAVDLTGTSALLPKK